jgi:hypothetical protein|tara:strand:- start:63 stop:233 length:171 start_codon:yes stop_codon:yes gene_type:complete
MRYKVLKDFHTPDGVLYKNEIVKEWASIPEKNTFRVKDSMGRIWNISKNILIQIEG